MQRHFFGANTRAKPGGNSCPSAKRSAPCLRWWEKEEGERRARWARDKSIIRDMNLQSQSLTLHLSFIIIEAFVAMAMVFIAYISSMDCWCGCWHKVSRIQHIMHTVKFSFIYRLSITYHGIRVGLRCFCCDIRTVYLPACHRLLSAAIVVSILIANVEVSIAYDLRWCYCFMHVYILLSFHYMPLFLNTNIVCAQVGGYSRRILNKSSSSIRTIPEYIIWGRRY